MTTETTPEEKRPTLPPLDLSKLDPGVRAFVAFLRSKGFETTDSGDGVTKKPSEDDDTTVLPWPHVFIVTRAEDLRSECDRLWQAMHDAGLSVEPGDIQGTYDPSQEHPEKGPIGVIALVDDEDRYIRSFSWLS